MKANALQLVQESPRAPVSDRHEAELLGVIENIHKEFRTSGGSQPVVAVENASFTIRQGEFVSLLGPSGCGKTTLLRIVGGLNEMTSGVVKIDGREVSGPQRSFGFVFQSLNLLPWRTVRRNILLPMEIMHRCDATARERAEELLELVGLKGFGRYRPPELSGGMQQRVALCRALIHRPSLLLMDEPFGALDELTRMEMQDLLLAIRRETHCAILFVTHSISEAIYLSDKVLIFDKSPSRIVAQSHIDLPDPREGSVRYTPTFTQLERWAGQALGIST